MGDWHLGEHSLILASGSAVRSALLSSAGLSFSIEKPQVDERSIEAGLSSDPPDPVFLAQTLAREKALDVSARNRNAFVIGCDQTLSLGSTIFHKANNATSARATLMALRGRTHHLNSGVAIALKGKVLWDHVSIAEMKVRTFSGEFLEGYLERNLPAILSSVGCYQLEGEGVQLFTEIKGDYFTVLGLPLLPLLEQLRKLDVNHA
ncbi:Maf family protein [Peteryoungia desertarenae]|uniref:Nucleoside triphosphate pyrophosphatase n=1 Tax=Peteryoungia desertarenae TaxID=1813451 RepID=A0ABX6QL86_9HYPH|nr:Maf family protein [Peteryoungia desertarenae]QLF68860.1 Maf family protein [Peteryoungia desertarenae]